MRDGYLQGRREVIDMYRLHAERVLQTTYHPWERYKRTFAIVSYFNVLFGPTFFSTLARYAPEAALAVEHALGAGLIAVPLLNTIFLPALMALLEMTINRCCQKKIMPEPDLDDQIPWFVALPILDFLTHKVIGNKLSLSRAQVTTLLVVGTVLQLAQGIHHVAHSDHVTFLDRLYGDSFFTFVGQFFFFGLLLPKLFDLLPDVIRLPLVAKGRAFSKKFNEYGFRLFDACHPRQDQELLVESRLYVGANI